MIFNTSIFSHPEYIEKPSAWIEHIPFAFFLTDVLKPKVFVELGIHFGASYFAFCQAIAQSDLKTKAFAVDHWQGDEQAGLYNEEVFEYVSRINNQHFSHFSNLLKMSFDEANKLFDDGSIDLLHIDGLHTYEAVKHDFEFWLPKMSEQGVMIFHDTAVKEHGFGVWKLMDEIKSKYPSMDFKHGHGLGVLCVGEKVNPEFLDFVRHYRFGAYNQNLFASLGKLIALKIEKRAITGNHFNTTSVDFDLTHAINLQVQSFRKLQQDFTRLKKSNEILSEEKNKNEEIISTQNLHIKALTEGKKQLENQIENSNSEILKLQKKLHENSKELMSYKSNPLVRAIQKAEKSNPWLFKFIQKYGYKFRYFKKTKIIRQSGLFDEAYYLISNPDVKASGIDPLKHYLLFGGIEGRNPSRRFDANFYLKYYPDVSKANFNPLLHYMLYGKNEKRQTVPKKTVSAILLNDSKPALVHKEIPIHSQAVDIIICVHNALDDVKKCLSSVIRYTSGDYNLIIVDDGSASETRTYLEEFSKSQGVRLFRNDEALGYTKAANIGLKESTAPLILLLNSDTIVAHGEWLDRLVLCAQKTEKTGMVSPLSNTASWQSVPGIFSGDDWADNRLPADFSIEQMADALARDAAMLYPELPFLNGFCLLIKRACFESTGYFDELSFPDGYGEENDYCMRSIEKNWELRVADDVYIYHAQSKSYSHHRRLMLSKKSNDRLNMKHAQHLISERVEYCKNNLVLQGVRSRSLLYHELFKIKQECRKKFTGRKIIFILPVIALGGGANVIIQEIRAMRQMNVDCYMANKIMNRSLFEKAYPIGDIPVIYFDTPENLGRELKYFDVVIGTAFSSIAWIKKALSDFEDKEIICGYYIQDFEPWFFAEGSNERLQAWESYSIIPNIKCFTKTEWNRQQLIKHLNVQSEIISPSVNTDLFRPTLHRSNSGMLAITAMIRPETPRRSPELTMRVLKAIKQKYKEDIEIITFGCNPDSGIIQENSRDFEFRHLGILNPEQLSELFNRSHIFIDMSSFQAMGLTGMEAMACGNIALLPQNGGSGSFVKHQVNGFLIDTSSMDECLDCMDWIFENRKHAFIMQQNAINDMCRYSPYYAARNMLNYLFDEKE